MQRIMNNNKIQEEIENTIKNDYRSGEFPEDEFDKDNGPDYPEEEDEEDDGLGVDGEPF